MSMVCQRNHDTSEQFLADCLLVYDSVALSVCLVAHLFYVYSWLNHRHGVNCAAVYVHGTCLMTASLTGFFDSLFSSVLFHL